MLAHELAVFLMQKSQAGLGPAVFQKSMLLLLVLVLSLLVHQEKPRVQCKLLENNSSNNNNSNN